MAEAVVSVGRPEAFDERGEHLPSPKDFGRVFVLTTRIFKE
jgi:hypothetical protein